MTTWLAVIGASIPLGSACWWMVRRPSDRRRHERPSPDWGDWPSDQRMP
jgi:hypothetical protein